MNGGGAIRWNNNFLGDISVDAFLQLKGGVGATKASCRRSAQAVVARAVESYLGDTQHYAVTYGDGLTNADLAAELDFHLAQNKIGTVLGVNPPSRLGEFRMAGGELIEFVEKPELHSAWINGGSFFSGATSTAIFRRRRIACWSASRCPSSPATASSRFSSIATSGPAWIPSAIMSI